MKTALQGMLYRKGVPNLASSGVLAGYGPSFGGFVIGGSGYVPWASLQTSAAMQTANNPALQHNGQLVANNPIDQAITQCQDFNNNRNAFEGLNPTGIQWTLKLRIAYGINSPAWVCNDPAVGKFFAEANQGPGEVTNGDCPCFWTTTFATYANAFEAVLIREYDGIVEIEEIIIARCSTVFTEPMIRQQIADSLYVSNANAAGYSYSSGDTQTSIMTGLGYLSESSGAQRQVTDGVLNGTTTLTSATAAFVSGDVGSYVIGPGIPFGTTIASRTNGTTVLMSTAAVLSLTGGTVTIMDTGTSSDQQQQLDDLSRRVVGGGTWAAPTGWADTRFGYAFNPYPILPGSGKDFAFTLIVLQHAFAVGGVLQFSAENNSGTPSLYPPNTGQYPTMFADMGGLGSLNGEQTATSGNFSGSGLNGKTTLATIAALNSPYSSLGAMIAQAALTQNVGHIELPVNFQNMLSAAEVATLTGLMPTQTTTTGGGGIRQRIPFATSAISSSITIPHATTLAGSTLVIVAYARASSTPTISITGGGTFTKRPSGSQVATGGGGAFIACDDIGASAVGAGLLNVSIGGSSGSICGYLYELIGTTITYEGSAAQAPGASTSPTESYTTTQISDIVIGAVGWNSSTISGSNFPAGFTNDTPQNGISSGGVGSWLAAGTLTSASLGAQTYSATLAGSQWWAAAVLAYRVAGGAAPGQPTGVVGTPGSTQATITFTAPNNGGSAITSTLIQTYLGGVHQAGLDQTITGTGTSKVVTGLSNGTAYQSSATCTNANGTGPESALSVAYTPAAAGSVPSTPAAPTGFWNGTGIVWSWTAPSNGGSAITEYDLTETLVGSGTLTPIVINDGPPPDTFYEDDSLVPGTYTATFTATNSTGASAASPASASVVVPVPTTTDLEHLYLVADYPSDPTPAGLAPRVLIGFQANPSFSGTFVLGTSILGGTDTLESFVMTDVTTYVTETLSGSRGRSRETDQYAAGTMTIILRNENRDFDPTNTASPYYPGVVPRAPIQVTIAGQTAFTGYVDDFQVDYEQPSTSTVSIPCTDGFGLLAMTTINSMNANPETSGQRIADVLDRPEIAYPGPTNLATGIVNLQASMQDQIAGLDHCQTAAASESGLLYCDRFGVLQFKDQTYIAEIESVWPMGVLQFSDNLTDIANGAIGYTDIAMLSASTLLFNQVQGTRTGGVTQQVDWVPSEDKYLIRCLTLPSLECVDDPTVKNLCNLYLLRYAFPEVRFDTVTVELVGLSPELRAAVAALDLGNAIQVTRTPPGGGSPIVQLAMIEAVNWSCDASMPSYKMTFGLMNITSQIYLTLGSTTQGVLGQNKIF